MRYYDSYTSTVSQNFKKIKNEDDFERWMDFNFFPTHNIEIDEKYYINGKAFKSLFGCEWLHGDIIDCYLNEWRGRTKILMENPDSSGKTSFKIFNTFWFTRMTRGVFSWPSKKLDKDSFLLLQENARKVAREKTYANKPGFTKTFDFDVLIMPIHFDSHWTTGIIYKPKNCLINRNGSGSPDENNDSNTYIIFFDSIEVKWSLKKSFNAVVFTEYIKACSKLRNEKLGNNNFEFDVKKLKLVTLKKPLKQDNENDCGLFMVEFIRQVILTPNSIIKLINGCTMKEVYPKFNVDLSRDSLKLLIYSKVGLEYWIILYEMEQFYLTQYYGHDFKRLQTRSDESMDRRQNIREIMTRKRSFSI